MRNNFIYHFSYRKGDVSDASDDAEEGHYEGYRDSKLPEGYTPYRQNAGAVPDSEYDRYEYDHAESPNDQRPKKSPCEKLRSCCSDMGRLITSLLNESPSNKSAEILSPIDPTTSSLQALEKDHR